jgi:hypothetical protein
MRRLVLSLVALGLATGFAAPALAGPPPIPVGVSGEPNNGICVTISYMTPQCIDLGQP